MDCIVPAATFDCNVVPDVAPCTYNSANRPVDFPIRQLVIHDIEGTVQDALNVFQDPNSFVSVQYIVDTDGTIYQSLHEKDVPFAAGNLWYNEHTINIEHAGVDATGFLWYNATEYLASAKLVAHLLRKYGIPLDHDHVIGHSDIPGPNLANTPNHVDPGPYWLWGYYFGLIHQQGVSLPDQPEADHVVTIHPASDRRPLGRNGTETPANFNFFYLYQGPSTRSPQVPTLSGGSDVTDASGNVETRVSYAYVAKAKDAAGTGATMYQVWYGEFDQAHGSPASFFQTAHLAWLAVPAGASEDGAGAVVTVSGPNGAAAEVYGRPTTNERWHIGDAPAGAVLLSADSVLEDGTTNKWYEINFNHRQAWVPAAEVTLRR